MRGPEHSLHMFRPKAGSADGDKMKADARETAATSTDGTTGDAKATWVATAGPKLGQTTGMRRLAADVPDWQNAQAELGDNLCGTGQQRGETAPPAVHWLTPDRGPSGRLWS